jgi:hypothetical protein
VEGTPKIHKTSKMIKEDYVSFEVAKLLKEKGFDEECIYVYRHDGSEDIWDADKEDIECQKPTLQMAMKWLRKKKIVIIPVPYSFTLDDEVYQWVYSIWCGDNLEIDADFEDDLFDSYEEACEDAMKYALENFI